MNMRFSAGLLIVFVSLTGTDLAGAAWDADDEQAALLTIEEFKDASNKLAPLFSDAWGYAVFPSVGKGGIGIGGAYGTGVVFERGTAIGTTKLYQVSFGFQFGGQAYSEVVFFQHKSAMAKFKSGTFKLGAQASAVAVTAGASEEAGS